LLLGAAVPELLGKFRVVRQLEGPDTVRREPVGFENALHRTQAHPDRLGKFPAGPGLDPECAKIFFDNEATLLGDGNPARAQANRIGFNDAVLEQLKTLPPKTEAT
jgi:hypothetical protein